MWLVREREREEEIQKQSEAVGITEVEYEEYKISWWNRLYHSNIFRGLLIILLIAVLAPILIFLFIDMTEPEYDEHHTCVIYPEYQILCGPQPSNYGKCSGRKCCFNETDKSCYHAAPSYYVYTGKERDTPQEDTVLLHLSPVMEKSPFGVKNKQIYLSWSTKNLHTLSVTLSETKPLTKTKMFISNAEYNATIYTDVMAIVVNRTNTNKTLFSTAHGPTIISDKYWEWTVDLQAQELFGMDFFRIEPGETVRRVIYKNAEDHTSVPRFMAYQNGTFHGLEIEHTGPLEVTVLPSKLIVLRMLSGDYLTLHLSTGPKPVDVFRQQVVTSSFKLPYWALGVHICRDGPISSTKWSLQEHDNFLENNKDIPYDSDCIHENMFSLSKTITTEMKTAIDKIQKAKKHFMMSLAPQISIDKSEQSPYKEAENLNILVMKENSPLKGKYLGQTVAFPEYSSKDAETWFKNALERAFPGLDFTAIGLLLRSNWPVNENYEEKSLGDFQYMPEMMQTAMKNTIPWNSYTNESGKHIETHNTYGFAHSKVVANVINPAFLLSSSFSLRTTLPAHVQNVNVSWADFKNMLTKTLSHSLFGAPLYSTPVCGSTAYYDAEISQFSCLRWYLTAATLPLFRISSDEPRRDPSGFEDNLYMKKAALEAINIRYTMLPYYSTALFRNSEESLPLVRPMFFSFPEDNKTFSLNEQYMVGDSLLIVQPTLFPIPNLDVYLPEGEWYEFWGGQRIPESGWISMPVVETDLIVFVAAGSIVPIQDDYKEEDKLASNAEESLQRPLKLVIALNCSKHEETPSCNAAGSLFVSDSLSLEFNADENSLRVSKSANAPAKFEFSIATLAVYKQNEAVHYLPTNLNQAEMKNDVIEVQYKDLEID